MKRAAKLLSLVGWAINLSIQLLYLLQSLGIFIIPHRGVSIAFSRVLGMGWVAGAIWAILGLAIAAVAYARRGNSALLLVASAALYLIVWYWTGPLGAFGFRGFSEAYVFMEMFGILPLFCVRDVLLPVVFMSVLLLVAASSLRGQMRETRP